MIELETRVKIPFLWGKSVFKKNNFSNINLIVGPNGAGKTLLAQSLAEQFYNQGYGITFIKSERHDVEAQKAQLEILKTDTRVREKIERVLSSMFGKSIKFIEDFDDSLIPIVENKAWNVEYLLEDAECHGLKEIISLLISLYRKSDREDPTMGECLFFDEPELHLHPQFQTFFMNKIRKEVQHSSRRIFFLISHSPFFIDLRTPEDLIGVIACHTNKVPTTIDELDDEDENLFTRFLPRFNTYHKQFFFSDNQIFVEGYTDQQMFTNLLPYIENEFDAAGTGIIDVGGKDELGVFCKVCALLGTNSRIITDLDSLFSGKLRDVASKDIRTIQWLEKQEEKQWDFYKEIFSPKELNHKVTVERLIFRLERYLIAIGKELEKTWRGNNKPNNRGNKSSNINWNNIPRRLRPLIEKLKYIQEKHGNAENVDTYKTVLLQGVENESEMLEKFLPPRLSQSLPLIKNLARLILAALEASRVYILPKGCIEHYYYRSNILYMPVSGKDRLFRTELDFIQSSHRKTVRKAYSELIDILERACSKTYYS